MKQELLATLSLLNSPKSMTTTITTCITTSKLIICGQVSQNLYNIVNDEFRRKYCGLALEVSRKSMPHIMAFSLITYFLLVEEKEKPIEARYPVSQGYGHKRAIEKGGAVKGSGRAILFNKVTFTKRAASLDSVTPSVKTSFVLAKRFKRSMQTNYLPRHVRTS